MTRVGTPASESGPVEERTGRLRRMRWGPAGSVAEAACFAILLGISGSLGWRVARVAVVVTLFVVLVYGQAAGRVWRRGLVTAFSGLLGTVAGAGIGLTYLVKSGPLLPALAGTASLCIGLVLLLSGTATLIRSLPGWWHVAAIPCVYIVLQFVLLPVTTGIYAANAPSGTVGPIPSALKGMELMTVSFQSSDGTDLGAWYIPSAIGATVIVVPGSGSTRTSVADQAALLARRGYGVLLMDNRGHGTSGGAAMDFGWWGERDLAGAVNYLLTRPDVRNGRIGILGESMGGEEAIGAIGQDRRVEAVVAEGVTGRTFADTAYLGSSVSSLISRADSWVSYRTAGLLSRAPEPESVRLSLRAAAPRRILIIAGRDEISADRYFQSVSPANVQLWELPDTGHTAGLHTHPAQWEQHVIGFFAANL